MIKTGREIALLKKAARISNSCISIIEKALKEGGLTEREIARRIQKNIYKQGGRLSFRTLVASGKRSATIHAKPAATDKIISGIGYVDFGASYKGYKSDVTVPFIKGKVSARERRIVKTVLQAYNIALKSWRIGMPCWKLHEKVDSYIRLRGFEMGHGLGHGLGIRIHERPLIAKPRKKLTGKKLKKWERIKKITFQSNMAFTIEPGVYVKDVGGSRLENSFLAAGEKLKSLTRAKLIEV